MTVTEKITPLQAWHLATSIKLHFDGKLDAVKYHYKMPSLTQKAFDARKDRYHFEKLARRHGTTTSSMILAAWPKTLQGEAGSCTLIGASLKRIVP